MSRTDSPLRDRMIFVVGARRSGTNWLQRILCARPDVAAVPSETYLFSHGLEPLVERFQHASPASPTTGFVYMEREAMLDALRLLCDRIFMSVLDAIAPKASRLVERTPDHVRHLRLIADIYPDAYLVHIIRDGRDVARSLLAQDWGPSSIEDAAKEWRSAIAEAREVAPGLPRYREVRYEELLSSPQSQLSTLLEWLQLDASPGVVDAALLESGVGFNVDESAPQIVAEKWRASLTDEDLQRFNLIAGDLLTDLGYPDAGSKPANERQSERAALRPSAGVSWLRRRIGRSRTAQSRSVGREIRSRATDGQSILDRALSSITARRFDSLRKLVAPGAYVRFVGAGTQWDGRGGEGLDRLIEAVRNDPALDGRVVRGDVHPSAPTLMAVTTYRLPDGSTQERVLVVTVVDSSITRLTYYRLPLDL